MTNPNRPSAKRFSFGTKSAQASPQPKPPARPLEPMTPAGGLPPPSILGPILGAHPTLPQNPPPPHGQRPRAYIEQGTAVHAANPPFQPPAVNLPAPVPESAHPPAEAKAPAPRVSAKAPGIIDRSASTQSLEDIEDCIPPEGIIRDYMEWVHRTTHAPPMFHLAAILPVVAFEAARRGYTLDVENSPEILLRVWTCIVGSSGAGKGTALMRAKDYAEQFYEMRRQKLDLSPYLALEGSIPGVLSALADKYFDESTQQTNAILYHEELSKVLLQDGASEALIMLYDGRDYTRNLRSIQKEQKDGDDTKDTIKKPCLSAVFTTPSASLEKATTVQHVAGGLYSRMLWMVGDVTREKLMFRERREEVLLMKSLNNWCRWSASLDGREARGTPRKVHLSNATEDILAEGLFDQLRARIADDTRLQGVYLRMLTHARILAGLFAFSRGAAEVDLDDMCRAVNLATVCLAHVEYLDEQLAVSANYRLQTRILEHLQRRGPAGSTKREIYQTFKLTRGELENAAESLLDRGEILEETYRPPKGRPSSLYVLAEYRKGKRLSMPTT